MECIAKIIRFNITLIILFHTLAIISCTKEIIEPAADGLYHDYPSNEGIRNALEKARLIAEVEWTPLNPVPSCYGYDYPAFETRHGLPYSLAQKVNGYVGLDVSFYTFLTALNNPRSVMYTENLRLAPYNGFDCAPYYGSVCSMSVWYALGIKATYFTSSINGIPELKKEATLGPEKVQLCDVLWKSGHVAMVYDIGRDDTGAVQKVSVFETTRRNQWDSEITAYSYDEFVARWNQDGWIVYRPRDLSNNPAPDAIDQSLFWNRKSLPSTLKLKKDLCTNHGDRVSYPEGDSVVINVLNNSHSFYFLDLYKDDSLFQSVLLLSPVLNPAPNSGLLETIKDVTFSDLPYGTYKACLRDLDGHTSNYTYFEIIDINVSFVNGGNELTVYFSSANATPVFLALVNSAESPHRCHVFNSVQLSNGCASVNVSNNDDYFKVFFKGEYGRISNKKIKYK